MHSLTRSHSPIDATENDPPRTAGGFSEDTAQVSYELCYTPSMEIRDATIEDAEVACEVTRRSITDLSVADHKNNATVLALWLSNKTRDNFAAWIAHQGNSVLVAVEQGIIVGVGAPSDVGEITLNYVSPDARFRGVSRALLAALENRAMQQGNSRCKLTSTETAHRFYRDSGYIDDGSSASKFSALGHPMSKLLGRGLTNAKPQPD